MPLALHGKGSAARLNTMLVTRTVHKAKLTVASPQLVAVPFTRAADGALHPPGSGGAHRAAAAARGPGARGPPGDGASRGAGDGAAGRLAEDVLLAAS